VRDELSPGIGNQRISLASSMPNPVQSQTPTPPPPNPPGEGGGVGSGRSENYIHPFPPHAPTKRARELTPRWRVVRELGVGGNAWATAKCQPPAGLRFDLQR
jgi:hypothetical protein